MPHECTTCGRVFADGSKKMLSGCPDCGGNKFQFKPAATGRGDAPAGADDRRSDPAPDPGRGPDADPGADADATDPAETSPDRGEGSPRSEESRRDLSPDSTEWPDHGYGSAADPDTDASPDDPATSPGTDASPDDSAPDPDTPPTEPNGKPASTDPDAATDPVDAGITDPSSTADPAEDPAQSDARTDVVSPDEIAAATPEEPDRTADPDAPGAPPTHGEDPGDDATGRVGPRPDDRPDLEDLREELNEQFESIRIVAPGEYELNLMELYDRTEYIISLQEDGRYVIEVPDTWDTTPDPDGT